MRYESQKTERGNVGVSYLSQEAADAQGVEMDDNGCFNCTDCTDCSDCTNCVRCFNCTRCSRCSRCTACFNCTDCTACSGCFNCSRCTDCFNCTGCSDCSDCFDCTGVLVWRGPKAEKLIAINGLIWPVATDGVNVQIGCQQHTAEAWQNFNDAQISRMDSRALEFWKQFKATVFAMVECRRSL